MTHRKRVPGIGHVQENQSNRNQKQSFTDVFLKQVFLKHLEYSQENTCWNLFLKNRFHSCFPVNIGKFLRAVFL